MRLSHKMLMIVCLWPVAVAGPAHAGGDVPPAIQAFLDNVERQMQIKPAYESIESDGGAVVIHNLSLSKAAQGEDPAITLKVGEATFRDISEDGDSLYQVGSATFSDTSMEFQGKDGGVSIAMPEASAEGWYIQALGDSPTPQQTMLATSSFARRMTGGKLTITAMGQSVTADGFETNWDGDPKTGSGNYAIKMTNISIPESVLALVDQGGMLKQLGYTDLSFDIAGDGTTAMKGDTVDYAANFGIAGRDIAGLKIGFAAGDVPLAVYAEFQKAQAEGKQPDFEALMPQIQNISISGASFRFEDASITRKVLPMIAAMQGMDEKTLVASAGPMLQMGLMQLQNEAFAQQAVAAVNAFLAEPKSLTIAAKPAQPLTVSDIMALDPNAPGEAITRLGVSVSAND
jgi:hypothetical protein